MFWLLSNALCASVEITKTSFESLPLQLFYMDSTILLQDTDGEQQRFWRSKDQGKHWDKMELKDVAYLVQHPHSTDIAFALTRSTTHYKSVDKGQTWTTFQTPIQPSEDIRTALSFSPFDKESVLFRGLHCQMDRGGCRDDSFYTTNGFKSVDSLLAWTQQCDFSQKIKNKVFCLQWPENEQFGDTDDKDPMVLRLVASENFYKDKQIVSLGQGVPNFAMTEGWLLAVSDLGKGELGLFTSQDNKNFKPASLSQSQDTKPESFAVLDSTNNSLVIAAVYPKGRNNNPPYATIFTSNSDGSYFFKSLEHVNRDINKGEVDFERIGGDFFDGIMLANTVSNWKQVSDHTEGIKRLISYMSFNNGAKWSLLKPPAKDAEGKPWTCTPAGDQDPLCSLHLHSVTTMKNVGRVFSTSSAPGIIVGVGSVGKNLAPYEESDTFISKDAGRTWTCIKSGPMKYEVIDMGATIVLIPDSGSLTSTIFYSKNQGETWESASYTIEKEDWAPLFTTLDPGSKSQSVLLFAGQGGTFGQRNLLHLDFSKLYSRQCAFDPKKPDQSKDFELFKPVSHDGGECLLGQSVGYYRRKKDADCFVASLFENTPHTVVTQCDCTDVDFECDANYAPDPKDPFKCVQVGPSVDQPLECKGEYKGSSGYRKIPGNMCKGGSKADPITKKCQDLPSGPVEPPKGSEPVSSRTEFEKRLTEMFQVKETQKLLALAKDGVVWKSDDQGKSWTKAAQPKGIPILKIIPHDTVTKRFFFISMDSVYVTDDALEGDKWSKMDLPEKYNAFGLPIIDFHPTQPDWYVYVAGGRDCPLKDCFTKIYITKDGGKSFKLIDSWSNKCLWALDTEFDDPSIEQDAVICASYKFKDGKIGQDRLGHSKENPSQLVMIMKEGKDRRVVLDQDVADYYVVNKIMVAAVIESDAKIPTLYTSINGQKFVKAKFPPSMELSARGYTLLNSRTGGVFLDVVASSDAGREFGNLFKSNEEGQFFSRSLPYSNRGSNQKVDLEQMPGIQGVLLANRVMNAQVLGSGVSKAIESLISYDDASTWQSLVPPVQDSKGIPYHCQGKTECKLHLHSFADNANNKQNNGTAGLLIAVGSVGEHLQDYDLSSTFLTRDGGKSWKEVAKKPQKFAILNYGGLLVMMDDYEPTNEIQYSWDLGRTWATFKFSGAPLRVQSIQAVEQWTSCVIIGRSVNSGTAPTTLVYVDFSKLFSRTCTDSDFELWKPTHFSDSGCFFGHQQQYRTRKADAVCRIDNFKRVEQGAACECTLNDYECDYNFFRNDIGECMLYGKDPDEPQCNKGDIYKGSSGYRKISLSKCKGGKDLTQPVDRVCGEDPKGPGEVKMSHKAFDGHILDFFYFESSPVLLIQTNKHQVFVSKNDGMSWDLLKEDIVQIVPDPFVLHRAFLIGKEKSFVISDKGNKIEDLKLPAQVDRELTDYTLSMHPRQPGWLIYSGSQECNTLTCHAVSFASFDTGRTWTEMLKYGSCRWGADKSFSSVSEKAVFCRQAVKQEGDQRMQSQFQLVTADAPGKQFRKQFDILGFAIEDQYMVAAVTTASGNEIHITMNGRDWAQAVLPENVKKHVGYTVLSSDTGSLFMHVIASLTPEREYGTVVKSNWNGTFYSTVLPLVNQNRLGFADFEKVKRLNGTLLGNQLVQVPKDEKELVTKISFDDGQTWQLLDRPEYDSMRRKYNCDDCHLHLHAYTERKDPRDSYTSPGAVGLLIGVGNVGQHLTLLKQGDMFLSRDGGRSWNEIAKGAHMFEIGDHGGIILMINDQEAVGTLKYSLNGGLTFREYQFSKLLDGTKIRVTNILTESSGTTSHFVILGKTYGTKEDTSVALHLDFNNVWPRQCQRTDDARSDFEQWSPSNLTDSCILGQKAVFYRRKLDRECQIGSVYQELQSIAEPCPCTEADFECDANFVLVDGKCVLQSDKQLADICVDNVFGQPSGYVKKKISGCQRGLELHLPLNGRPCKTSGTSFVLWFFLLSLTVGCGVLFYMYQKGRLDGYGRIRLPDDSFRPQSNLERVGHAFSRAGDWAMDVVELVAEKCGRAYDWVLFKIRGYQGYRSVGNNYYDADLPTDGPNLNWQD
ncbi:hypothetical protein EDD86DRAFT_196660 [Gorgonomyces haynaldii]|nr:hypothetical protein EDD86DRAFT_196660 [Gorgonomyces haynaldii]